MVMNISAQEMMNKGLTLFGYDNRRQGKVGIAKNSRRFVTDFGKKAKVLVAIWNDLQSVGHIKLENATNKNLSALLWTFYWLKNYATEESLEGRTGLSDRTI